MAKETKTPLPTTEPARSVALSAQGWENGEKKPPKTPSERWAALGAKRFAAADAALVRVARVGNRKQYQAPDGKLAEYIGHLKERWAKTLAALEAREPAEPFSLYK